MPISPLIADPRPGGAPPPLFLLCTPVASLLRLLARLPWAKWMRNHLDMAFTGLGPLRVHSEGTA
jgi:hypothetical protein